MKKLVPFKKDIVFDTNIAEINSISLEHEVTTKKESLISGKFIVSGDYKMTDTSVQLDTFDYELPFNINIDKKYIIEDTEIDISDFYYEIVNNKILSVNIELTVDRIEEKEEEEEKVDRESVEEVTEEVNEVTEKVEEVSETTEQAEAKVVSEDREVNVKSLFDGMDENEIYVVYKVHIVTENDTIESICLDYGVTKDQLEAYNSLSDIKIGDKLIVPANEN